MITTGNYQSIDHDRQQINDRRRVIDSSNPSRGDYRDQVEMESTGTINASSSSYSESNDVMNAMAEGYY